MPKIGYTYSEARENFAKVLDIAEQEPVRITRRGGASFILMSESQFQIYNLGALAAEVISLFHDFDASMKELNE